MISLGGCMGAIVTYFGDKVHYMNRDVTDWIYAVEGFIAALISTAWVLQMICTRYC